MKQTQIAKGRAVVKIVEQNGRYDSRLYVNCGETATTTIKKATTMAGAVKQATKMLASW